MDTSQKTSEETLPAGGVVSGTAGDAARDAAAATLRTQLNHRTIRDFDGRPLGEELTATLVNAALHAATSQGMQYATIIRVQDPARRQAIADVHPGLRGPGTRIVDFCGGYPPRLARLPGAGRRRRGRP
ncbi:nitroreductase family protein [Actinotignum sp. GS-2025b]|uniref:nitroreductase family protein n=1 Tax=Actinotignum sp. GS-2025b TaxID=3427275 RepID=UPI003F45F14D